MPQLTLLTIIHIFQFVHRSPFYFFFFLAVIICSVLCDVQWNGCFSCIFFRHFSAFCSFQWIRFLFFTVNKVWKNIPLRWRYFFFSICAALKEKSTEKLKSQNKVCTFYVCESVRAWDKEWLSPNESNCSLIQHSCIDWKMSQRI